MNKRYLNNYITNKKSQILLELKFIELLIISFSKYKGKRFFNKGIKENESDFNEILFIKLLIKIIPIILYFISNKPHIILANVIILIIKEISLFLGTY